MTDDFLKFDQDKLLDDFNFNVSSAIPENELLEFNSLDPSQLLNDNSYFSPVGSPYIPQSLTARQSSISKDLSSPNYFSPAKSIPLKTQLSPNSYNDTLSPYSSFDPSSFKSPASIGASPIPSTSFNSSSLPKQQLSKEDKLRRRREFHNQVERRRRDLIKEKIKELGLIVPPSLLYIDEDGKEVKASKNVIINKTVDYVVHLHKVMSEQESRKEKLESKIKELELINGELSNSATPIEDFDSIKLEDSEFDVNEFLKEHNETWDHSNV